jgi:hypothetical protein
MNAEQTMKEKAATTFSALFEAQMLLQQDTLASLVQGAAFGESPKKSPKLSAPMEEEQLRSNLIDALAAKRKLGNEKYGALSFQNSFENFMQCPLQDHLREELLDAINYATALYYRYNIEGSFKKANLQRAELLALLQVYFKQERI